MVVSTVVGVVVVSDTNVSTTSVSGVVVTSTGAAPMLCALVS